MTRHKKQSELQNLFLENKIKKIEGRDIKERCDPDKSIGGEGKQETSERKPPYFLLTSGETTEEGILLSKKS